MADQILWGRLSSCNVQKAQWVLEELGLAYEHVPLGGDHGGLDDPAYRSLNPHGKVPTLKDGDTVVWESDAIVRYLAARYGEDTLWEPDPARRAMSDQWMIWASGTLYPPWIGLFWRLVRVPPEKHNTEAIARQYDLACGRFRALDRHLADRPYMAGDSLGIADFPVGMTLFRWYEMPIARPEHPNVDAYYARLRDRPAYRKAICRPFDDLVGKESF